MRKLSPYVPSDPARPFLSPEFQREPTVNCGLATASLATAALPTHLSTRWIIDRDVDLSLVIGSSLAGYLYLFLNLALHVPITFLWWFWSIGLDGTHIFGTASRTFFDREARRQSRALLFGSVVFFFSLGPALVLLGQKPLLILIVAAWAYYHIVRQHYGFMVLYKVKNRDLSKLDNILDRILIGVMLVVPPLNRFLVHHPEELGMPRRWALAAMTPAAEPLLWTLVAATLLVYAARQGVRINAGEPVNLPKFLLFAGVFPLHWITFATLGWQAAVPTVTIVHNLQYHALIWFHNRNRYSQDGASSRNGRVPAAVAKSLASYALLALVFSLAYRIPGFHLGRASDLAFGFFCGFGLTHYYLDSKIWRVRRDPSLRMALKFA